MITLPSNVSLKSLWKIANSDKTLLRALEDEKIANLSLEGKTLDIGGGAYFSYVNQIKSDGILHSVNISFEARPTLVADLNSRLPIADGAYDNVVCFNTLEHIYEEHLIFRELLRILKPDGGRFIITVPFLYRRHGKYGDYHRHTAEYWERLLCSLGLQSENFTIQPFVLTPLSSALASLPWFSGGIRGRILKLAVLFLGIFSMKRLRMVNPGHLACDFALGFFIEGRSVNSPRKD
ncbi:MAG: class I SAM-dependent methyltransferase [Ferrovibrio sp.]|uniref:class I SAM-dependent methyltransferase n=1 Tax=Ferrovibrio sp. TaxID=1917215 RepID=UPI003918953E